MAVVPTSPRAMVFIDGQNLFYAVKEAFGYVYPNYEPLCLAQKICKAQGWAQKEVHFYTGMPDEQDDGFWHHFWKSKLAQMGRMGIQIFSRLSPTTKNKRGIDKTDWIKIDRVTYDACLDHRDYRLKKS